MKIVRGHSPIYPPGILRELFHLLRGREQMLVRAPDELPLVVISYARGSDALTEALRSAICVTYRAVSPELRERYAPVLRLLPPMVVVVLRNRNACTCLGHHHRPGTEGRIARRLSSDTGLRVGEIDMAVESIRQWEPLPLAALAAEPAARNRQELEEFRFL